MRFTLNISTCPNDTFMFDAMIHHRIDTEGLRFDLYLSDIEQLNQAAMSCDNINSNEFGCAPQADITKLSYAVVPKLQSRYKIISSGSALGRGNGPIIVSRNKIYPDELCDARIAIAGEQTTANLLLQKIYPTATNKKVYLFSDIAEAVMSGECDCGVLIHEGRFTYQKIGLQLIADLGVEWEKLTRLPLPLGAIAVSQRVDREIQIKIQRVIARSIQYAFANPSASASFVREHAKEMSQSITAQHIDLFVNKYSIDLGEEGRKAVVELLQLENEDIFV